MQSFSRFPLLLLLGLAICGCKKSEPLALGPSEVPEVKVQEVKPETLVVKSGQPGRLDAYRRAEVRARVPGIVLKRTFEEGQEVKEGTVLFQIDPALLQAAFNSASASFDEAGATYAHASDRKRRYVRLVSNSSVSVLDMQQTAFEEKQALARLEAAKAAKETARLRLEYATVTSPIGGRVRRAEITEGALVGEGSPTLLTTVEQIDPIYVNFSQPVSEVVALRKALEQGSIEGLKGDEIKVTILLDDGSPYSLPGNLVFSDLAVDAGTDTVQLRAVVPNPNRELFPGMYVKVSMDVAVAKRAILVPREALIRTSEGAIVKIVNSQNQVAAVEVEAKEIHGGRWHILSGLSGGERIVVENPDQVQTGTVVKLAEIKQR